MPNNSNNDNSNNQFLFGVCLIAGFLIFTAAWRTYLDNSPKVTLPTIKMPVIKLPVSEAPTVQVPITETPSTGTRAVGAPIERAPIRETSAGQAPEMPSPNAYDFYTEAAESLLYINYYNKERNEIRVTSRLEVPESTAGKEALLKKNAKLLAQLKQGLKYSCLVPDPYFIGGPRPHPARRPNSMMAMHFYDLAQLLLAESQIQSSRGNWKEAANVLLDMQKFGHDITQGATSRNASHSRGCRAASYRELQKIYPRLSSAQSKAVVRRWEEILKRRVMLVDSLRKEKQITHSQLSSQSQYNTGSRSVSPLDAARKTISNFARQGIQPDHEIVEAYDAYADTLIALAQAPFDPQAKEPAPPMPDKNSRMAFILMTNMQFQQRHLASLQDELRDSLLLTTIALHAYKLEHKTYPRDLKQLVPTYLKQIPRDVFGDRKPLLYALTRQTYSLYSVGPDRVDDQGRAIQYRYPPDRPLSDASIYQVYPRSQGDIVMGVNIGRATP